MTEAEILTRVLAAIADHPGDSIVERLLDARDRGDAIATRLLDDAVLELWGRGVVLKIGDLRLAIEGH